MKLTRYLGMRLKTLRGMTVVHIGAHFGQEAAGYERLMARRVCWIEANPETFQTLQKNLAARQNQARPVLPRLLGEPPTEHICINALIAESDGDQFDFFRFNNEGASDSVFHLSDQTRFENLEETGSVLELTSHSLDKTLADNGIPPEEVDVLVLDTQGAELLCLKGGEKTLDAVQYVESEVSVEPVYEGGVLYAELAEWLEKRGFTRKTRIRRSHSNVIFGAQQNRAA